jgi:hypothetical protein
MPASLLDGINLTAMVVVVIVGTLVRAWISLRKAHLHEKAMTDRFTRALEGSSPQQRPDIIRAMGSSSERHVGETAPGIAEVDNQKDGLEPRSTFAWIVDHMQKPPAAGG